MNYPNTFAELDQRICNFNKIWCDNEDSHTISLVKSKDPRYKYTLEIWHPICAGYSALGIINVSGAESFCASEGYARFLNCARKYADELKERGDSILTALATHLDVALNSSYFERLD